MAAESPRIESPQSADSDRNSLTSDKFALLSKLNAMTSAIADYKNQKEEPEKECQKSKVEEEAVDLQQPAKEEIVTFVTRPCSQIVSPREQEQSRKHFNLSVVLEEDACGQSSTQSQVNFNECYKEISRNKVLPGTQTLEESTVPQQLQVISEKDSSKLNHQQSTTTISNSHEPIQLLSVGSKSHRSVSQLPIQAQPAPVHQIQTSQHTHSKEALEDYLQNCNLVDQEEQENSFIQVQESEEADVREELQAIISPSISQYQRNGQTGKIVQLNASSHKQTLLSPASSNSQILQLPFADTSRIEDKSLDELRDEVRALKESNRYMTRKDGEHRQEIQELRHQIEEKNKELQKEKKSEELLQQTEELLQLVQEQTDDIKERDSIIQDLQKYQEQLEQNQQLLEQNQKVEGECSELCSEEKEDLRSLLDQKQEKLAIEFNKKRKMKQEYEDQLQESQQQITYYQEKYKELKVLLNDCREQLKNFEDLNEARNQVIEKLENDNIILRKKLQQHQMNESYISNQTSNQKERTENILTPVTFNHSHKGEKSFSLNLQQVKCGQSQADSSVHSGAQTIGGGTAHSFYKQNFAPTPKQAVGERIRVNFFNRKQSKEEARELHGIYEKPELQWTEPRAGKRREAVSRSIVQGQQEEDSLELTPQSSRRSEIECIQGQATLEQPFTARPYSQGTRKPFVMRQDANYESGGARPVSLEVIQPSSKAPSMPQSQNSQSTAHFNGTLKLQEWQKQKGVVEVIDEKNESSEYSHYQSHKSSLLQPASEDRRQKLPNGWLSASNYKVYKQRTAAFLNQNHLNEHSCLTHKKGENKENSESEHSGGRHTRRLSAYLESESLGQQDSYIASQSQSFLRR